MNKEQWKPIIGYEKYYEVSDAGRVRSKNRVITYNEKSYLKKGRILKLTKHHKNSYLNCTLSVNNIHKLMSAHRLVATEFIENPQNLPEVNHKDGNKSNNHVSNLEWTNRESNVRHANENHLINYAFGDRKPKAHFTNDQVRLIKQMAQAYSTDDTILALGFKLNQLRIRQTICKIRRGKKYKHVI